MEAEAPTEVTATTSDHTDVSIIRVSSSPSNIDDDTDQTLVPKPSRVCTSFRRTPRCGSDVALEDQMGVTPAQFNKLIVSETS